MPDVTEFLPVVSKLRQKTEERKVEWKGTYDSSTFICTIEGEYSFEITKYKSARGNLSCQLSMKDKEQVEVFVLNATYPTENSSQQDDDEYELLDSLFERARRNALNIDKKLNEVSGILDKL